MIISRKPLISDPLKYIFSETRSQYKLFGMDHVIVWLPWLRDMEILGEKNGFF